MDSFRYRAFISYSHRDSLWADWLHKALEHYRVPKKLVGSVTDRGAIPKRLSPIFRDRDELPSATDLGALITAALSESAAQVVICSPRAAQSKWVNEEILAFKRLGGESRIFCLIVDGEPNATDLPGRELEECFPQALRYHMGADGVLSTQRTEPIAADARAGKDGKNRAKLKLIAGLLGVGFDTLRRREQQRRNRRLFVFSCSAAAGMVLTSGLAAYALFQRSAAQHETARAEAEAQTAKETTRFLVDMFKISDPGEARGNSVTAREMLDKGAARIEGELSEAPAIKATLMDTLGTVYMGLGLYAEARPLLDGAVDARQHLPGVGPLDLSASLSHQGELLYRLDQQAAGEKAFTTAVELLSTRAPDRETQIELAAAQAGLGNLLADEGRYADAEKNLQTALQLRKRLYGTADPAVARTMKELAFVIADAGDLATALPMMQEAVALQRTLRGARPHPDLAEALNDMGVLLYRRGDMDDAEKFYRESLAMKRQLLGDKHPEIAAGLENIAMSLQDKGDLAGAETLYRQALDMRRELLGLDHPEVGRTLMNLASLQYDRGETQKSLDNMAQVLAIYRKAYPADHPETARALNVLGFSLALAGNYEDADRYLSEGLAIRQRLFDEHQPDLASSLMNIALLRDAQGHYADALELAQRAKGIDTQALSADHWRTAIAETAEGAALAGLKRYPEAEERLAHANDILGRNSGAPLIYRSIAKRDLEQLHADERRARPSPGRVLAAKAMSARGDAAAAPMAAVSTVTAIAATTSPH